VAHVGQEGTLRLAGPLGRIARLGQRRVGVGQVAGAPGDLLVQLVAPAAQGRGLLADRVEQAIEQVAQPNQFVVARHVAEARLGPSLADRAHGLLEPVERTQDAARQAPRNPGRQAGCRRQQQQHQTDGPPAEGGEGRFRNADIEHADAFAGMVEQRIVGGDRPVIDDVGPADPGLAALQHAGPDDVGNAGTQRAAAIVAANRRGDPHVAEEQRHGALDAELAQPAGRHDVGQVIDEILAPVEQEAADHGQPGVVAPRHAHRYRRDDEQAARLAAGRTGCRMGRLDQRNRGAAGQLRRQPDQSLGGDDLQPGLRLAAPHRIPQYAEFDIGIAVQETLARGDHAPRAVDDGKEVETDVLAPRGEDFAEHRIIGRPARGERTDALRLGERADGGQRLVAAMLQMAVRHRQIVADLVAQQPVEIVVAHRQQQPCEQGPDQQRQQGERPQPEPQSPAVEATGPTGPSCHCCSPLRPVPGRFGTPPADRHDARDGPARQTPKRSMRAAAGK